MSTRQRATLDSTAEPGAGARLLLARPIDQIAQLPEDIGAQRLRELAARLSGGDLRLPSADDSDSPLDEADAEFAPVSLADIVARSSQQTPDAPDDALIVPYDAGRDPTPAPTPLAARVSAPAPVSDPEADEASAPTVVAALPVLAPSAPLLLAGEAPSALAKSDEELLELESDPDDEPPGPEIDEEPPIPTQVVGDQPLLLADQSVPDIRLVDLIRRQQTLLEQLNRFPPAHDASEKVPEPELAAVEIQPPSVIEQLAPRPAVNSTPPVEFERASPPPLPPPELVALSTSSPSPSVQRERQDEAEPVLPEQSPKIIQRARAERTGRRMPAVAAPPSAVPAFVVGLAAAVVIAGVLFAVL